MDNEVLIRERYQNLEWALDERLRRLYAAAEAKAIGRGGITLVSKATGVARRTIQQGLKELAQRPEAMEVSSRRIRRRGGGRKATVKNDTKLLATLKSLVEPVSGCAPESPLGRPCKSLRQLESELKTQGFIVSHNTIGNLLKESKYAANQKLTFSAN
jgi:hypothetical protein